MARVSEYGIEVKKKLIDKNMTQENLISMLREKTELFVDGSYLYKILSGQREAPKIKAAINEILDISDCN